MHYVITNVLVYKQSYFTFNNVNCFILYLVHYKMYDQSMPSIFKKKINGESSRLSQTLYPASVLKFVGTDTNLKFETNKVTNFHFCEQRYFQEML